MYRHQHNERKHSASIRWVLVATVLLPLICLSHPGRTDGNGGHPNADTGDYHFHHRPLIEDQGSVYRVIDGDTFLMRSKIQQITVRIAAIGAPEDRQTYGEEFHVALKRLIGDQTVTVTGTKSNHRERFIGFVTIDGVDVGEQLVKTGNAWDYPKYSKGLYKDWQKAAREAKYGLWATASPLAPWAWRKTKR